MEICQDSHIALSLEHHQMTGSWGFTVMKSLNIAAINTFCSALGWEMLYPEPKRSYDAVNCQPGIYKIPNKSLQRLEILITYDC